MYSLKILDISLTFSVLNEDKSISFKDWHLKNIFDIYLTFVIFKEDKLIFSNDSQERNILDIFLTYCELNEGKKFISVKDVHPWNIFDIFNILFSGNEGIYILLKELHY